VSRLHKSSFSAPRLLIGMLTVPPPPLLCRQGLLWRLRLNALLRAKPSLSSPPSLLPSGSSRPPPLLSSAQPEPSPAVSCTPSGPPRPALSMTITPFPLPPSVPFLGVGWPLAETHQAATYVLRVVSEVVACRQPSPVDARGLRSRTACVVFLAFSRAASARAACELRAGGSPRSSSSLRAPVRRV
jgi:hypothetical protein